MEQEVNMGIFYSLFQPDYVCPGTVIIVKKEHGLHIITSFVDRVEGNYVSSITHVVAELTGAQMVDVDNVPYVNLLVNEARVLITEQYRLGFIEHSKDWDEDWREDRNYDETGEEIEFIVI